MVVQKCYRSRVLIEGKKVIQFLMDNVVIQLSLLGLPTYNIV